MARRVWALPMAIAARVQGFVVAQLLIAV